MIFPVSYGDESVYCLNQREVDDRHASDGVREINILALRMLQKTLANGLQILVEDPSAEGLDRKLRGGFRVLMQLDIANRSTDDLDELSIGVPLVDELEVLRLLSLHHSDVDLHNHRVQLSNELQFCLIKSVEGSF